MTLIIVLAVAFLFYWPLHSRLNRLEEAIKDIKKSPVPIAPSYSASVAPQVISIAPIPPRETESSEPLNEAAGGRLLAILGVIAVFVGLAFFLKFAFDNNLIGVTGRIILGYALGVLAIILGVSLRSKYAKYADTLTGGGIAVLYLTTFAAYDLYHLFSSFSVYSILILITIVAAAVSIYLTSEALVMLSFIGAFAAPMIMTLYKIDIFPLLGYVLIIALGNAFISYWYKWSRLNLIGIIGSFLLLNMWLFSGYLVESERVLGFLFTSLYFAIFLISTMMHHIIRKEMSEPIDAISLSLNGLCYGALGYMLLEPIYPDAMGYFMLVISVIYFLVALVSFEVNREDKLLNVVLPAIAAFFLTIAIPIHFKGASIPVAWVMEALLMFIVEYSIRGKNLYIYGAIVYILGLVNLSVFHLHLTGAVANLNPIFNERFMLFAFAAIVGYIMAYIAHLDSRRGPHETAGSIKILMAALAEAVGLVMITFEINTFVGRHQSAYSDSTGKNTFVSIGWVVYAAILTIFGFIGRYRTLRIGGLVLFFITAFKIFIDIWAFGPLYRIVASIVFGTLALLASFAYSKFKDRLFVE